MVKEEEGRVMGKEGGGVVMEGRVEGSTEREGRREGTRYKDWERGQRKRRGRREAAWGRGGRQIDSNECYD